MQADLARQGISRPSPAVDGPWKTMVVDRSSSVPLYAQLRDFVRSLIKEGVLAPGAKLPTEKELMAWYGLSSSAVRQALLALVQEGLIERSAGKGTIVRTHHFYADQVDSLASFAAQLESQGHKPHLKLLEFRFVAASPDVAHALGVPEGSEVFRIVRLHHADDEPVILIAIHHPRELGLLIQPLRREMDKAHRHRFYAERLGIRVTSVARTFRAELATAEEARALGVPIAAPVMIDERIATDQSWRPFEHARAVCRGDRLRYQLRVVAGEPGSRGLETIYDLPRVCS